MGLHFGEENPAFELLLATGDLKIHHLLLEDAFQIWQLFDARLSVLSDGFIRFEMGDMQCLLDWQENREHSNRFFVKKDYFREDF